MDFRDPIWQAVIDRKWRWGIPSPIWLRDMGRIGEIIKEMNLKPMAEGTLRSVEVERTSADPKYLPKLPPLPGGIKIPHLHFDGKVFLMNEEQWEKFAGGVVIDGLKAKLKKTRTVSF
jgi:hypothetical protein